MSEKYTDLEQTIIDANDQARDYTCSCYDLGVEAALEYLDRNPDQVRGRTITESEVRAAEGKLAAACSTEQAEDFLLALGITVVPDHKPTNAEKLAKEILTSFNKCEFDFESSFEQLAKALDARGIKAPGGEQ